MSFDVKRLAQFQESLQVYRHLLDGEVVPQPIPKSEQQKTKQKTSFKSQLFQLNDIRTIIFWIAVLAILLLLFAGVIWQSLCNLSRTVINHRYLELYSEAAVFMEQLNFQSSQAASTGFSWRGITLGKTRTQSERDLTLPGLTARYTNFLSKICAAYNGKCVIVIDELDKIHDPEQVKELLVEIKGALFCPGIFYLISISEDAARSFRRRLASGRDIFESTFDDVLDIDRVNINAAVSILQRLEETGDEEHRLPDECLKVAAMFGGGIPREIIRARRTLSFVMQGQDEVDSVWAARTLDLFLFKNRVNSVKKSEQPYEHNNT